MTALTVRAGRREIGKIARASREKTRIPFPCNNIFHGNSAQINSCPVLFPWRRGFSRFACLTMRERS